MISPVEIAREGDALNVVNTTNIVNYQSFFWADFWAHSNFFFLFGTGPLNLFSIMEPLDFFNFWKIFKIQILYNLIGVKLLTKKIISTKNWTGNEIGNVPSHI